jgi:formylglycine-generating enzyme required for sulfatase activity
MWVIMMGIEHEKIHIETSSVLHRQLDIQYIKPNSFGLECTTYGKNPKNELLDVPSMNIALGKDKSNAYYGWDNEYGVYEEQTPCFKASKYLVSNGEFLEFVNDGGYEKDKFWSEEGQRWKAYKQATHPIFWIKNKDGFLYRTLSNVIALPLNWPVDVNYLEAHAFCQWKSEKENRHITLPSEALWHALREFTHTPDEPQWGEIAPANINLVRWICLSLMAFLMLLEMCGNGQRQLLMGLKGLKCIHCMMIFQCLLLIIDTIFLKAVLLFHAAMKH